MNMIRVITSAIGGFTLALALASSALAAEMTFESVLAAAKKEGKVTLWVSTPNRERTHRALLEAFNKRFDLDAEMEWVALHPVRSVTRLIAEAAAGRVDTDIVGAGSAEQLSRLVEKDLVKPYPWEEVFGSELPTIAEPAGRVLAELRGMGLLWFDNVYGVAWNTNFVKAEEVPTTFAGFAEPEWKGKFVLNALGGTPVDMYSLVIGVEPAFELAKKVFANQPVLKRGTPTVSRTITSGEGHLGLSSFFNADRAQKFGEPQEFRFFDNFVPVLPLHVYVPENAPHPNMARLFAAWLVTEGARITGQLESAGRVSDKGSKLAKSLDAHLKATSAKVIQPETMSDVRKMREMSNRISAMVTGRKR